LEQKISKGNKFMTLRRSGKFTKYHLVLAVASLIFSSVKSLDAYGAICEAPPKSLNNGTTADASDVMANFNSLVACVNNKALPVSGPSVTGWVEMTGGIYFLGTGSGLYNQSGIYNDPVNGFLIDVARQSDSASAAPHTMKIEPRGGGTWATVNSTAG
jgi:hypothetical protein